MLLYYFFLTFWPITTIKLEGRVVGSRKAANRAPSRTQVARSKLNELLLRRPPNPTPEQSTSASTSTSHSPPLNEATSYASLTNVNLECLEREEDVECGNGEYKHVYQLQETKYIFVDQNGKAEESHLLQNTSPKSIAKNAIGLDGYKGTTLIINTSVSSLEPLRLLSSECTTKSNEPMEPNSVSPQTAPSSFVGAPPNSAPPHPSTPHYNQIPAYEYVHPGGEGHQPHYQAVYEPHSGTPSYYLTTGYNPAEYNVVPDNTRYVLEHPPAGYYPPPNGYVQPSSSNAYPHVGYPLPHGSLVYPTSAPPYDQRAQLAQRHFVDQKGYPIVNRNVVQIMDAAKGSNPTQPNEHPNGVPNEPKTAGKPAKKRSLPAPTHTITSVPINVDMESNNVDPKKQFKCPDCGKCVSSSRNLTRHRNSCKSKKKSGDEAAGSVQSKSSSSSLGSPPKPKTSTTKQPKSNPPSNNESPQTNHPTQLPHQPYQNYPQPQAADGVIYHGHPPPNHLHHPYSAPHPHHFAPPPHTALPHSNSQPIFDYPSSGLTSGLHSAPPTMGNYQQPPLAAINYPPLPNSAQSSSAFDPQQRPPVEYRGEAMNNPVYAYPTQMDRFIENTIDEMVTQNPLAYIGGGDYESSSSADRSLHDSSDFPLIHPLSQNGPKTLTPLPPNTAGPSNLEKPKASRKSGGGRKNTEPTPHRCSACDKYMCSQRSLRRHKSTCKLYLKTTPELTNEERQMIAKNEENKCENCGKILQSPSNLRRHKTGCKQKSEDESKPPLSSSVQSNNSPTRNPTIVEHLTSQTVIDSTPKRLMPPPEAQESSNAFYSQQNHQFPQQNAPKFINSIPQQGTVVYMKSEEPMYQSSSYDDVKIFQTEPNLTIGEHLRHHYKPSGSVSPPLSNQKQPRRPPFLGRKSSLQNSDMSVQLDDQLNEPPATCPPSGQILSPPLQEFHSRSAPPTDIGPKMPIKQETKFESAEAIRKSEQVADVINSVVEKIRRQNVAESMNQPEVIPQNPGKRANNSAGPTPTKVKKVEQPTDRPLSSIITTQPLPASSSIGHLQPSPQAYNQAGQIVQRPIPPVGLQSSQIQVPLVTAEQQSTEEGKVVARYMCPECYKFYACRKNVKAHRINTHSITEAQADANVAKRVKVRADSGFILTPGFDRENVILQQRSSTESIKPTVVKSTGQPKKRNSNASNGEAKNKKSPNKPLNNGHPNDHTSPQLPSQFYHSNGLHPTTSISPQYEELHPVPLDAFGPQQHLYNANIPPNYNPTFMQSNDLELWDQIKSRVDVPYMMSTREDEIDVARIAADLKRSAESEVQQVNKISPENSGDSNSEVLEPKVRNVELAEADSTFCEDETGVTQTNRSLSNDSQQTALTSGTQPTPLPDDEKDKTDDTKKPQIDQLFTPELRPIDSDNAVKVEFQSS